jgi:hypothetical protein
MTSKEKAEELINKMYQCSIDGLEFNAKQCALIAVNEIYNEIHTYYERYEYWEEVKQEIEKL